MFKRKNSVVYKNGTKSKRQSKLCYIFAHVNGSIVISNHNYYLFKVTIKTDNMDLAGDVIQGLSSFLGIEVKTPFDNLMLYNLIYKSFICNH